MNEEPFNQMFSISDFDKDEFREYLTKELEVIGILDYLFEWYVIELVDHDIILESKPRSLQVQKILEILKRRDERCLKTFCYILKQHSHPRILRQLQLLKKPILSPLEGIVSSFFFHILCFFANSVHFHMHLHMLVCLRSF